MRPAASQSIQTASGSVPIDLVAIIESVLNQFVIENEIGVFRWQQDGDPTGADGTVYKLKFLKISAISGVKSPLKSTIVLKASRIIKDSQSSTALGWQVRSSQDFSLCKTIVEETDLAIREALLDESKRNHNE